MFNDSHLNYKVWYSVKIDRMKDEFWVTLSPQFLEFVGSRDTGGSPEKYIFGCAVEEPKMLIMCVLGRFALAYDQYQPLPPA